MQRVGYLFFSFFNCVSETKHSYIIPCSLVCIVLSSLISTRATLLFLCPYKELFSCVDLKLEKLAFNKGNTCAENPRALGMICNTEVSQIYTSADICMS